MSGWGNQGQGHGWGHGQGHGHGNQGFQNQGQWQQGMQGQQWPQGQQGQQWGQQPGQFGQQPGQFDQGQQWGQQPNQQWGQGQQNQQWGGQQQGGQWGGQQQGGQWGQQQQGGQWGGQQQGGQWGGQQQQWGGFQPVEGQLYKLVCGLDPNFVLDVSQNPNDYNKLILWPDSNGANQKFTLKSVGGGKYGIFCAKNGMTVEIPDGNNGARVQCSQPNKQPNEFW